ncbi:Carbohydrate family 9 binding domain-like [Draconibacterium orientale]|uniref:Carbohydrate family 9 binding domain-like n=2 Tax=Draconibacterium orientale TaxID=1168034 RepID=A0A1I0JJM8_9BACT|nr:DUF5916 domain-containing protein [Draconibacterium orientale]SEU10544.1 Carbohydrate family 9 binding domain-like [Draconibacterium orientale]
MKLTLTVLFCVLFSMAGVANGFDLKSDTTINTFNKDYVYHVKKLQGLINIDGVIDEIDWERAQKADKFYRVLPVDTGFAKQPSTMMMAYDDKALYVAQIFYDTIPGKRVMESFRRDFSFGNNDNLLIFFDTFLDQTNGFSFGVSASGAKWDGTMSNGSSVSLDWDCKWEIETKHYDDRWVSEMRIPFKSVRYPKDSKEWNVNFSRLDLKSNEKSAWAPVPRQFPTASLAYTGRMKFEEPLPKSKMQFSVIPYLLGGAAKDFEAGTSTDYRTDVGFDAKVGISSSMTLDLTYNPDFAQVEVDQQVTNIDRFELFFPEKRQFFLENSDLFSSYGYEHSLTPFFSRRIGLDAPVLVGGRLSGKIGNDWRVGFMNMATEETSENLARNFTVASVQKKMFTRSSLGFIAVNKEYFDVPSDTSMYNRVIGLDYNLASKDNVWDGKFFYHRSFQPGNPGKQYAQGAMLEYSTSHLQLGIFETSVGENYRAEAGYVRRTGYNFIGASAGYTFVPNKKVVNHGPSIKLDNYFNPDNDLIEHEYEFEYELTFANRAELSFEYSDQFVKLRGDFNPTQDPDHYLPEGSEYDFGLFSVSYQSTRKSLFTWEAEASKGSFYSGDIQYIQGEIGYRFQPYVNLTMNINYTDMDLGDPFSREKFWLVAPKMDITFTDKIFWSTFVQYNEQIDNLNINSRFQWRYQPVSDIYLVYTDNYFTGNWNSRNRAVVLKMTYWFN